MKIIVSVFMVTLILFGALLLAFDIRPVKASGAICIRVDGSIDPPTAPIQRNGDLYTFTGDIIIDYDGIVIEKDGIVLDGAGYTLQGSNAEGSRGIYYTGRTNVGIVNTHIRMFDLGIWLDRSSLSSVSGNTIADNGMAGIFLNSSSGENSIIGNNITANFDCGISLIGSSSNTLSENNITSNWYGVWLGESSNNNDISGNTIASNGVGVLINSSSGENSIIGNNITANFDYGISLIASAGNTISANNITSNSYGVGINTWSYLNTVSGNTIADNGMAGIFLNSSSYSNSITGNDITANFYGVSLTGSAGNTISANNITANTGDGIRIHSGENIISNNNIAENLRGIRLDARCNYISITDNNITANTYEGIQLNSSYGITISGNNVTRNSNGIWLEGWCWGNSVLRNNITANTGDGVHLHGPIPEHNSISENNITTNHIGIRLEHSIFNNVSWNEITSNNHGIYLSTYSDYNNISENNIAINDFGIQLNGSENNRLDGNIVAGGKIGICLNSSSWNNITGNEVRAVFDLASGYGICLNSSSWNSITENDIVLNIYGVWLRYSSDNRFYHNNFISNICSASLGYIYDYANVWDNGYPSGGNYWTDYYYDLDVKSGPNQDQPGSDGIGDVPYLTEANQESNQDHFPLAKPWTPIKTDSHSITKGGQVYPVNVASNATILNFEEAGTGLIRLSVYGESGSTGSVRIIQPVGLNSSNIRVFLTNVELTFPSVDPPRSISTNGTHYCIYFTVIFNSACELLIAFPLAGDVNYDGKVNIFDIVRMAGVYGAKKPDPRYNPNCDVDGDGDIDIFDIVIAAGNYGKSW